MQPTNGLHLGNALGALKNWVSEQKQYRCFFMAVDSHAITVKQDPNELRENTFHVIATYLAAGVDPDHATLFVQSQVSEHAELAWVLMCHAYMGELTRMTQFKDKSDLAGQNIPVGLFTYPVLMAADILLYETDVVPVGQDQKQHLELSRDIAERMNKRYGEKLFRVPEPLIRKIGGRIMDLQNPDKKMSKSAENPKGCIFMSDDDAAIEKKIKAAVTDTKGEIAYNDEQAGVHGLIDIQASITGKTPDEIVRSYAGKQYGHLKVDTAEIVKGFVGPIRKRTQDFLSDRGALETILERGAKKAMESARVTLDRVYKAVGFPIRKR